MDLDVAQDQQLDSFIAERTAPFPRRIRGNEGAECESGDEREEWSSCLHREPP
jgi:hypothetical protein